MGRDTRGEGQLPNPKTSGTSVGAAPNYTIYTRGDANSCTNSKRRSAYGCRTNSHPLNASNIKLIGRIRKLDMHVIKLILSTVELNTKDIKLNVHGRKLIKQF